jgi:ribosomal RNA-processing protein 12
MIYEFPQVTVILEIMIRKCGSSAVELDIPEKHKSFFKTVLQVVFLF